jgi:hypothetical protein
LICDQERNKGCGVSGFKMPRGTSQKENSANPDFFLDDSQNHLVINTAHMGLLRLKCYLRDLDIIWDGKKIKDG